MSAENNLMSPSRRAVTAWAPLLLLLLSACAAGPDFVRPEAPPGDRYMREAQPAGTIAADGQVQQFRQGETIAADWWRLFNSAELDAAVKEGIANNPNLQAAQASLRQSQSNLKAGYGVFYPQVNANFSATRERFSPLQFGVATGGSVFNLFTLSAAVSYVIDIFGEQRRTVEALGAQADYQRYTMAATYMTLAGNIVNTMIAWAAYQAQIEATEHLIGIQKEQLGITQTQAEAGTVPYSNVLAIRSQLAVSEGALPPLRQRRDQSEHLLATLTGRLPADRDPPRLDLAKLSLPQYLPLSLPSDLVRQRPDILAAEAQLHTASANVGIATASLFPSFSLDGTYGVSGNTIGTLSDNKFWSIGPTVNFPLFQGGTLWYRRQAAIEGYQQSLAAYRQTVLSAFAQVADTLKALQHDAESVQAQSAALKSAQHSLALLQANYQAGLVSYVELIVADVQYYQARINYLQALAQRYQDTTALFMALGGGWWNANVSGREPPPSPKPQEKQP